MVAVTTSASVALTCCCSLVLTAQMLDPKSLEEEMVR